MGDHYQSRLSVGSSRDPAEAEADRTAAVVVKRIASQRTVDVPTSIGDATGWTTPSTRRLFDVGGAHPGISRVRRSSGRASTVVPAAVDLDLPVGGRVQRAATAVPGPASGPEGGALDPETSSRIRRKSGSGAPLAEPVRRSMESAFGVDFGGVGIHADSALPAEVGAVAFTHGNDVHFAPGQYRPDTPSGLHTLSHELTHVVQQGGAPPHEVHRLMSAEAFKKSAKESFYQVHGKTMSDIDKTLAAYDLLKVKGDQYNIGGGGIDKAINLLLHLKSDIAFWRRSHEGDTSRTKQLAALDDLEDGVDLELLELRGSRDAFQAHGFTGDLEIHDNKFVQKMEGSASSIFDKLSPIIAAAIPSPGDGAKLELTVKIPVDPSTSGYVGFTIGLELARGDRSTTKIGMKAAVNGGLQVLGAADLGFELGAFIEAQGKDPKAALQLISWGWYRRFRESILPREVASFMWGGSTGSVGWKRSETWAANVEKNNLSDYGAAADETVADPAAAAKAKATNKKYHGDGDRKDLTSGVGSGSTTNAYVRTGAYGSATAKGTIGGIATLEGGVTATGGTHYDRKTITDRKAKRGGEFGKAEAMPVRGTTTYLGTRFLKLEAALSTAVGPFSGSLEGALEFLTDQEPSTKNPKKKKGMKLEYLSGSLTAGVTVPLGAKLANELADGIIKIAPTVMNLVKLLATKARDDDESGAPEGVGHLVASGEGLASAFGAFPEKAFSFTDFSIDDTPMKSLGDQLKEGASVGESASTMSISIAFGQDLLDRSNPFAIDITVNSEQGIQLDASIVSLVATRSRRLVRLRFTQGKWKPSVD